MDENLESVKIRVRVKEKIPEEQRKKKRPDFLLWIIATILLGIFLGYLVTDQLVKMLRAPRIEYGPSPESVKRVDEEKMYLEHEDLVIGETPVPAPEKP